MTGAEWINEQIENEEENASYWISNDWTGEEYTDVIGVEQFEVCGRTKTRYVVITRDGEVKTAPNISIMNNDTDRLIGSLYFATQIRGLKVVAI